MKQLYVNIDTLNYSETISEDMFKSLIGKDGYEEVDLKSEIEILNKAMEAGGNPLVPQDLEGYCVVGKNGSKKNKVLRKKKVVKAVEEEVDCSDGMFKGVNKTEFSKDERKKLAKTGEAMKGGGYPIRNMQDLKDAIRAYGRAKDPEATKRHIEKRAKELNLTHLLPDKWEA